MAALLAGAGVDQVADEYGLPLGTVKTWKRESPNWDELVEPEKKDELSVLIADAVIQTLTTLAVQAEQFRDREWLGKQNAADVAVLYGVLSDKTFRILSAIEQAGRE